MKSKEDIRQALKVINNSSLDEKTRSTCEEALGFYAAFIINNELNKMQAEKNAAKNV